MIFAVAGTQLPFPRLMTALDRIAARRGLDVIAQTADPAFVATALDARPFIPPAEFYALFARAELIVAHAGMGVIIAAAEQRPTLEQLGAAGTAARGLPVLEKHLLLSTDDHPQICGDLEGMIVIGPDQLLLANDSDYGTEGATTQFWRVTFPAGTFGSSA